MTFFLALLGAVGGAVLGGAIGFFGVILLGYATGADDQQGALAMGAAVTGLPVGLVIGAILGCVIVLRMRRKAGAGPVTGQQGLAALGITGTVLLGFYGYFFWEPPKPRFKGSPPVILAEIRLPAGMVDPEFLDGRRSLLRTYEDTYYDADTVMTPRQEGDWTIIETRQSLFYRKADRAIHAWVRPGRLLIFELEDKIGANPAETDAFGDWHPVTHIRPGFYEEDIPAEEAEGVAIRLRVLRPVD